MGSCRVKDVCCGLLVFGAGRNVLVLPWAFCAGRLKVEAGRITSLDDARLDLADAAVVLGPVELQGLGAQRPDQRGPLLRVQGALEEHGADPAGTDLVPFAEPLVDNGDEGWDTPFADGADGDTWYSETKGEKIDQTVSGEVTGKLFFICFVHPGMQGKINVEQP